MTRKQKPTGPFGISPRTQIIIVLAATLALDSADKGTISAVADRLKDSLSLTNTEVGTLVAVVSFVGALVTLPAGILADRLRRKTILIVAVAMWAAAMFGSGLCNSYLTLLVARLFLGAVTAAAWPCIASLNGDLFPAHERAGIYSLILTGEMAGTAIGFFVSTEVSAYLNWHWSFYTMALPSLVLVWGLWKYLPEPQRGGQSWLSTIEHRSGTEANEAEGDKNLVQTAAGKLDAEPRRELVRDAVSGREWLGAIRYYLRIPSFRRLVVASALAYFFFAGVRAFGMIYFQQHYGLSHQLVLLAAAVIGGGALLSVVAGGHLSEHLLARGHFSARVLIPAVSFFAAIPFLGAGIWARNPWLGVGLLTVGGAALAAAVAPIDAARLDVIPSQIWGQAESGRAAVRYTFEGIAPLLLGAISGWIGLTWGFLILLVSIVFSAIVALPMHKSYKRDVVTAAAAAKTVSEETEAG